MASRSSAPGPEHGHLGAVPVHLADLAQRAGRDPRAPLPLEPGGQLAGVVGVEADLRRQDVDLVQPQAGQQVDVGGRPRAAVDVPVVADAHRLVPPGDRAGRHHRGGQVDVGHARRPERHPRTGVVVQRHDPSAPGRGTQPCGTTCETRAPTLSSDPGPRAGTPTAPRSAAAGAGWRALRTSSRLRADAGPGPRPAGRRRWPPRSRRRSRPAGARRDGCPSWGATRSSTATPAPSRPARTDPADVPTSALERPQVDAQLVLQRPQRPDHPGRAEDAAAAQHQPAPGRGHRARLPASRPARRARRRGTGRARRGRASRRGRR